MSLENTSLTEITLVEREEPATVSQNEERSKGEAVEKRFTLRLSSEAVAALDWLSEQRGDKSYQEIIRRSIGTEKFLVELINSGATILIEKPGERLKELVFR